MAESNDELEFPGSGTITKVIDALKRPFAGLCFRTEVVWDESDEYDFTQSRRGVMVVFNNEFFRVHAARPGSAKDAFYLKTTFTALGFEVQVHENQTRHQMLSILKKLAKKDHSGADCFACVVLSHGDQVRVVDKGLPDRYETEDLVYATDEIILTSELVQLFTDKTCPSLQGKPRLFFIQACRGNDFDSGAEVMVSHDEVDAQGMDDRYEVVPCPIYKDFLIMYATPPGHYAFRRPDTGSWFISGLCEVLLRESVHEKNFHQLLTDVIALVSQHFISRSADPTISGKKQCPCFASMLVKDIYFRKSVSNQVQAQDK